MVKDGIKSVLRNKSNIIYIVIFIIIAIIVNIAININSIIDKYYDNEFDKLFVNLEVSEVSELYGSLEEYITNYRTIGLTMAYSLDDDTIETIKKINHVEEVKKIQMRDGKIWRGNTVIVDDWKNCTYVQRQLNKLGLDNYVNNELIDSYSPISKYSNIISCFALIISFIILLICCNNILKNEKTNNKILNVLGYTYRKIKNIAFVQLIIIMAIGFIFGAIIANIIMFIYANTILKIDNYYNITLTVLINISIIILPIIISLRKIKYRNLIN